MGASSLDPTEKAEQVLQALAISRQLILQSDEVDESYRVRYLQNCSYTQQMLQQLLKVGWMDNETVKELANAFLLYWNESASITTEQFWKRMDEMDFHIKRKCPFRYALKNKKFKNEYLAMDARRNWEKLKRSGLLDRFSAKEVENLNKLIVG